MARSVSGGSTYPVPAVPRQIVAREEVRPTWSSLRNLDGSIPPRTLEAMHVASQRLSASGVRHALVGGLAVGVHGWPRGTKDVDFLIGREGYDETPAGLVTLKPEVLAATANAEVRVDVIVPDPDEGFLDRALDDALVSDGVPVISIEALVYMKLRAARPRDFGDVGELATGNLPFDSIRAYLQAHAPLLLPRFDAVVAAARR